MIYEFIAEYPDYGPKAKMTISRTKFYKWVVAYSKFKTGLDPTIGRDSFGKWIIINSNKLTQC